MAPKSIREVHRRVPVPSTRSFSNSPSLLASFAQKSIVQPSIRLSESSALFDSLASPPVPPASSAKPSEEISKSSEEIHKKSLEEIHKPLEEIHKSSEEIHKKSSEDIHKPSEEISKSSEEIHKPLEEIHKSSEEIHNMPSSPPPRKEASAKKPSPPPLPKSEIPLQRPTSQSPEASAASVPAYRPPADFLAEIRRKGAERMARSSQTDDQHEPSASPDTAQPAPPRTAAQPSLPANFLAEIRQKGAERMARSSQTDDQHEPSGPSKPPQPAQSLPQTQSPSRDVPPRPLPAAFLAEIRQKGAARQQAVERSKLSSQYGTLDDKSATTRRTGTLGSTRSLKRYGSSVLSQIHSGQNTLKICSEGEEPQQPKSGGNPLLDEIRNFDFSRLRKVDKEKPAEKNAKEAAEEPSLADLMRSRLECFQSDSSIDSDDSRFDFSD